MSRRSQSSEDRRNIEDRFLRGQMSRTELIREKKLGNSFGRRGR